MVEFKGSTQEKQFSVIFRFGYLKAANDKMVPDPVGSGCFSLCTDLRKSAEERSVQKVTLWRRVLRPGNKAGLR
jgi:hypothetical protein